MNRIINSPAGFVANRSRIILLAAAVFSFSMVFAVVTGHAWEDWFITYRAAKNLALGHGLVFVAGERVHSFTSPLGTLIPAFLSFITGNRSDDLVLWLFRGVSAALLAGASVMLLRIAKATGMYTLSTAILVGLFAIDGRIVDFSINGQEAALMMFFIIASLYCLAVPGKWSVLKLGISWAGLMWSRPDGFIYIGGMAAGYLLFAPTSSLYDSRRILLKVFLQALGIAALLYAPWAIFAWAYYGSAVPHTITAKGLFHTLDLTLLPKVLSFPFFTFSGQTSVIDTFMPPYYIYNGWPEWLVLIAQFFGLVATYYWCIPGARPTGRAVSFALFLGHLYLTVVIVDVAPWYVPNVTVLAIFVIASIFQHVAGLVYPGVEAQRINPAFKTILQGAGALVLLSSLVMTLIVGYQVKVQQEVIENGHRRNIGLWLKEHAVAGKDCVFLECLGYIGFYSQLKMLDFPGLSSKEIVAARKKLKTNEYGLLIDALRPEWLVLRPNEIADIVRVAPSLLEKEYQQVKVFDVTEKVDAYPYRPIRLNMDYSKTFIVFRSRIAPPVPKGKDADA